MQIQLFGAEPAYLVRTEGKLVPWNGTELPIIYPLKLTDDISQNVYKYGIRSGGRGAIIKNRNSWYKLKGCCPVPNEFYMGNPSIIPENMKKPKLTDRDRRPFGGARKVDSLRELEAAEKLTEAYDKHGIISPMTPGGHVEYEIEFDGKPVCCTVLGVTGDTRLSTFGGAWTELLKRSEKAALDTEFIDKVVSGMAEWLAFNQRMLIEAEVTPAECSFDHDNYIFHKVKGGYGVARVDLSSAKLKFDKRIMGLKEEVDKSMLREFPIAIGLKDYAKKFRLSLGRLLQGVIGKKGDFTIETITEDEKESYREKNGAKYAKVHGSRLKWCDDMEMRYIDGLEGKGAPKPIPAELLHRWYGI